MTPSRASNSFATFHPRRPSSEGTVVDLTVGSRTGLWRPTRCARPRRAPVSRWSVLALREPSLDDVFLSISLVHKAEDITEFLANESSGPDHEDERRTREPHYRCYPHPPDQAGVRFAGP